jgi:hypothetical protein
MLFLNQSDGPVYLAIGEGIRVAAKGTVEIPDGYSNPRRADNGSRRPSVVEELAGGTGDQCKLVPADPQDRAMWLQAPQPRRHDPKVANMPTVEGYVASGVPRGQAEILVRQAHQAVIDALSGKDEVKPSKSK